MASSKILVSGFVSLVLATGAASAQEVWRHGTVAPKGDAGIIYMAPEKGFDKQYGIKIEMTALKGDALLTKALLAGELDSYEGNPGGPMIAAAKGADIRIIGCSWPGLPYALYTKPEIKTVADLKGKSIAVSDPGALPDLFARAVLMSAGLDPSKDVTYVRAGSDTDRVKALTVGVVAAAPSSIEFQAQAPKWGVKMLVQAKDVTPQYVRSCYITTAKVLAAKGKAAAAFLAAEMKGLSYAMDHEKENLALAARLTGMKADDPNAKVISDAARQYKMVDPEVGLDPRKFTYLRDLLAEVGLLNKSFDPTPLLDAAPRKAALELVKAK